MSTFLPRRPATFAFLLLAGCTFLAACIRGAPADGDADSSSRPDSTATADSTAPADSASTAALVRANTAFALALYDRLAGAQEGNLFFSPHSLSTALAMTLAGAQGETAQQMTEALRFAPEGFAPGEARLHDAFGQLASRLHLPDTAAVQLRIANALWLQQGFPVRPAFRARVQEHYRGAARTVDFRGAPPQARRQINSWVAEQTENKIEQLFVGGALSRDTRLVLANAIYFLGEWSAAFDSSRTQPDAFTLAQGGDVQAPLMRQTGRFSYLERSGFQALELPYAEGRLAMTVFLPRQPGGLDDLTRRLAPDSLAAWLEELSPRRARVFLPRFTLEKRLSLRQTLEAMGMPRAFSSQAELGGMIAEERAGEIALNIDAVVHKAFVDVYEEGTEAAAATGVSVGVTSVSEQPEPVVFRADHPFFFVIRDRETGALLFMGRLTNPAA